MSGRRRTLYQGKIVDLGIERVQLAGMPAFELEIVRHPGGAGALAVDAAQRVCLLRQYRHAAGGWLWEVPAGKLDPGEAALATAQRELEEEAGLRARSWESLGAAFSTPGFCDERLHLFLARDLSEVSRSTEENEIIEVHWIAFSEALRWAYGGEVQDAKTLIALFRAEPLLRGG